MLAEISMGLSSLKAAADIVKGLNVISTKAMVNEVKITLQEHIINAQEALIAASEAQAATANRIRDLEQQIVKFENWEREKQRYQLAKLQYGFAYALKETMRDGEPSHYICEPCYQNGKKSILQDSTSAMLGEHSLTCPRCKLTVIHHYESQNHGFSQTPDYNPYGSR
jgi:hypothetical protein